MEIYGDERGEDVSVTVTGHSLGSALATLSAYDLAEADAITTPNGKKAWVTVFSFSGPRVGNGRFKERFEQDLGLKALRIVNVHDPVPKIPGMFFNERVHDIVKKWAEGLPWSYSHVGVELLLDHKRSPFLKETSDMSCFHNLEAHLHLLDGYVCYCIARKVTQATTGTVLVSPVPVPVPEVYQIINKLALVLNKYIFKLLVQSGT